jgi:hypothetical protein
MSTTSYLMGKISGILGDSAYTSDIILDSMNAAVSRIAAGIRMPDGNISPPLPDLYKTDTINTSIIFPYTSLPIDYQRKVFGIFDSDSLRLNGPNGGDYYSFNSFLNQINNKNLAEIGEIYLVCIKGNKLYYQGIPPIIKSIGLHYYHKPTPMVLDGDIPDGIPEHLHEGLIKHYVCKEIFGEKIEDGQDNTGIGTKYHTMKFFEAMTDLIDFIGIDAGPIYYGSDESEDAGICDG